MTEEEESQEFSMGSYEPLHPTIRQRKELRSGRRSMATALLFKRWKSKPPDYRSE